MIDWNYDEKTKTLTISGSGEMENYYDEDNGAPWAELDIEKVIIEDGVTSIGDGAFSGCSSLKSVTIKSPPCHIYDSFDDYFDGTIYGYEYSVARKCAEYNGYNFESLGLITSGYCGAEGNEKNVTWSFDKTTGTLTISGKGEMNDWDSEYGDYYAPWFHYDITDVIIENGVTSIGDYAFYECSLTSVMISDSVTSIGGWAFEDCGRLTSATIPDSVTYIGNGIAFKGTPWLDAQLEASPFAIAGRMVIDSNPKTCVGDIVIPDGITTIEAEAFSHCTGLTSVTIPNSVTRIEVSAFLECNSLTSVTIPDSVTFIGFDAFFGCSSLTSVTIPDSVTSIGGDAFSGCNSLNSVTIPDSVTSIGGGAFHGTPWLAEKFASNPLWIFNNSLIDVDETLKEDITIPNGVTDIGDHAFSGCSGLTSVTIPDSVTSIGDDAFRWCSSLTSVTIPESVINIADSAFKDCKNLTIHAKQGSQAQIFATEHGIKFESI